MFQDVFCEKKKKKKIQSLFRFILWIYLLKNRSHSFRVHTVMIAKKKRWPLKVLRTILHFLFFWIR